MPPNGALKHILAYLCRAPPRRRRSVAARADLAVVMGWEKKGVPDESWSDGPGSGPRLPRGCRRESQSGVWAPTFAAELGCSMLMLRRRRRGGGSNLGQAGEGQLSVGRRKKAIRFSATGLRGAGAEMGDVPRGISGPRGEWRLGAEGACYAVRGMAGDRSW